MANSAWAAFIEVLPDLSNFKSKANSGITSSLSSAGTAGSRAFGGTFLSGMGQVFGGQVLTNLAFGAGRVIGDALTSAVNFGLDGIQLASSLGEQANAVKVSFGEISDEILALADDAPKNLNLTRAAFDKLAVRFSSFAKTIAGQGGSVSKVIDQLTTRGADFASVYDIEVNEALELFQSGLAGETEPLRRFGIDLSEASVKAFAYANGIAEQGKQLTEAEKIQARYGSLLQQTTQVTGDLANTSDSLANQQRALKVGFEEAQTALGDALLPTMSELVGFANTTLIPKFKEVIDVIGPKIAAALEDAGPAFEKLTEKAGPLVDKLIEMGTDALPGVLDGLDQIIEAAPEWVDAFAWANDPDAQPAKFLNDLQAGLDAASRGLRDFFDDDNNNGIWDEVLGITGFQKGLDRLEELANEGGQDVGESYVDALGNSVSNSSSVSTAAQQMIDRAVSDGKLAVDSPTGAKYIGSALVDGIASGINSNDAAERAATRMARRVAGAARTALQVKSPSKVFEEIGAFVGEGFTKGIDSQKVAVSMSMRDLVSVPTVTVPTSPVSSDVGRPITIDPSQFRELLDAFKVELLTDDTLLASSAGRGSGFQTALGAA